MPSGLENLEGNRFILRYEHPWGGVASNASKEDIAPNQFVTCDGLFIKNGKLCSTNFYVFDQTQFAYGNLGSNPLYMSIPLTNPGNSSLTNDIMAAMYVLPNGTLIGIDNRCNIWRYDWNSLQWGTNPAVYAPPGYSYSCSQMIRGVIYMFDWYAGQQIMYNNGQLIVGTKFVGGKFCMTLSEQLITCNTRMQVWTGGTYDSQGKPLAPPAYTGRQELRANRVSWSAAQEAYSTWNNNQWPIPVTATSPPAAVDPDATNPDTGAQLPNDRTAGWNGLAEVQNEITGCFAMGNVGYILHDTGVTQMTPTASAILGESSIQPFDFTLLWGGRSGMGCNMPKSLAVYGHFAIWGNDNGFYLFSGSGAPQDITGLAKAAIFADINKFRHTDDRWLNIIGQICNTGVGSNNPEMVYNLYVVWSQPSYTQPIMMVIWTYAFSSQAWTRHTVNVTSVMQQITGNPSFDGVLTGEDNTVNQATFKFPENYKDAGHYFYESPTYGGIIFNTRPLAGLTSFSSFYIFQYTNDGIPNITDAPPVTNLTLRAEEFQIYRQPTIRGFIIRAAGSGHLNISVNGYNFQPSIQLNGDITKTTLYRTFGVWTGMTPEINISSTDFNGYITKIHAFGTYAEGEPI